MCLECAAWVNGIFSIVVVSVATALLWTTARPVLYHCIYTLVAPSASDLVLACTCLEAVYVCTCHVGVKLGTLAECAGESAPTWLCGEVDLWRKSCCDTESAVFL